MSTFPCPSASIPAELPRNVRLQIVSTCPEIPEGDAWLHEIKHDGHRLLAIVTPDALKLVSRNGYDRTALFREPFRNLAGLPPMVLDGEIAVPDDRVVTHIDGLSEAISGRRPDRLAYFAFDLLHYDGHDLRRCPLEDRKALLREVIGAARCERIVYVDHVRGIGRQLFEAVRQVGAEGIVSKRRGSLYRAGESREWLKTKCYEIGTFRDHRLQRVGRGPAGDDLCRRGTRRRATPRWAGALRLRRQRSVAGARQAAHRPRPEGLCPGQARAHGTR